MPTIDVVADANVALKWFHTDGEEEVAASRVLLDSHKRRTLHLSILDLTFYEIGNALLRGHAQVSHDRVATVLAALTEICPTVQPDGEQWATATRLAQRHKLTLYDAAYAAVALTNGAVLVTLDQELLAAGLGQRPSDLTADHE